jgi:hypothetical protein
MTTYDNPITMGEAEALHRQIVDVWADVQQIKDTLAERDLEQCKIEGVLESLDRRGRLHHFILGSLVMKVLGRGSYEFKEMYPESVAGISHMQGPDSAVWQRPARRWTQFGTKTELLELANRFRVKVSGRANREALVRALWEVRALPGSVALFQAPNYAEVETPD